jgi:putative membrane protein
MKCVEKQPKESNSMKSNQLKAVIYAAGSFAMAAFMTGGAITARAADNTTRGQLSSSDYKFAAEAAQGGMMEVSLGQLAAQKGADQAVRDFGKRMSDDHQKADDQLKDILTKKGAGYPDSLDKSDQRTIDRLNKLSGSDFDRAYMKDMVSGHEKDVKGFQDESKSAQDPDLKMWVNQTLPTVQSHLQQAQGINTTVQAQLKM